MISVSSSPLSFQATLAAIGRSAVLATALAATSAYADDVRVVFDNGNGDNDFNNPVNWGAFWDPTLPGGTNNQLPGYESGAPSNAIIQGASAYAITSATFTPAFVFNPLIVRGDAQLDIGHNLNLPSTDFLAGQTNAGNIINHSAGTLDIRNMPIGNTTGTAGAPDSEYDLSGAGVIDANTITINQGGALNVGTGTTATSANNTPVAGLLSGEGTLTAPTVLVNSGSFISPGDSWGSNVGTLDITGNMTASSGSTFLFAGAPLGTVPGSALLTPAAIEALVPFGVDPVGQHDALEGTGTLTLSAGVTIDATGLAGSAKGQYFDLLDFPAIIPSGFDEGPEIRSGSLSSFDLLLPTLPASARWDTSLFRTEGILFIVPEPSRALLLLLASCMMVLRRRRTLCSTRSE